LLQQSEFWPQAPPSSPAGWQFVLGPPQVPPPAGHALSQQSAEVAQVPPGELVDTHVAPHVVVSTHTAGDA
jgi:hypothetical protein